MVRKLFKWISIAYPLAIVVIIFAIIQINPFLLLEKSYSLVFLAVVPAVLLTVITVYGRRESAPRLMWSLLCAAWVVFVTFLHFNLLTSAAAAVLF